MTPPKFPTRRKFLAWRGEHPGGWRASMCPMDQFLRQQGFRGAGVSKETWHIYESDEFWPLPKWARKFVHDFDSGKKV